MQVVHDDNSFTRSLHITMYGSNKYYIREKLKVLIQANKTNQTKSPNKYTVHTISTIHHHTNA